MTYRGLLAGFAILLVTNALVLAGVGFNRSGVPDAAVTLTEREVHLDYSDRENSAVALRLNWRDGETDDLVWFDARKLAAVGFDCSVPVTAEAAELFYRKALPRQGFVVMESDGIAWQQWQARERKRLAAMALDRAAGRVTRKELDVARKRFAWEQKAGSRLFAVDVGSDPAALRSRYQDRSRYIITPASLRLTYQSAVRERGVLRQPGRLHGVISQVLTGTMQVPRRHQAVLRRLQQTGEPWQSYYYEREVDTAPLLPRYQVQLKYGKRHEPWIAAVQALPLVKSSVIDSAN